MRILTVVALGTAAPVAHAERVTTVNIGVMFGGAERQVDEAVKMKAAGGPRLLLGWEHAPLAIPPTKGLRSELAFVPEVTIGAVMNELRGDVMVGVGGRGELRLAQRDGGLAGVDARAAVYLAARVMVIGNNQDTALEGVLGEYIYLGARNLRLGGEISVISREQTSTNYEPSREIGVYASVYLGFAM